MSLASCSLPVGGSQFIIIGFEFVAEADALWPAACPGRWVDVLRSLCSMLHTHYLAPCAHEGPSSLEFLCVLNTTVHRPANSSGKRVMLFCKIFSPGWVFTKGILLWLKLPSCIYLLCTFFPVFIHEITEFYLNEDFLLRIIFLFKNANLYQLGLR